MTKAELNDVLEKHKKWLDEYKEGNRLHLSEANLRGADLIRAELRWEDLSEANLIAADLSGADLRGADLSAADLRGADLRGADLSEADLRGADLSGADLSAADLSEADLRRANLNVADLSGADLSGADLSGADLNSADLGEAKNVFFPLACPEVGEFVAFKKAANNMIVKLKIPAYAKRSSATTRKCRCDKAIVLSIQNADGIQGEEKAVSSAYDHAFVYTVGQEVSVPNFDDNRWNECSTGIHFFITQQEAVQYKIY